MENQKYKTIPNEHFLMEPDAKIHNIVTQSQNTFIKKQNFLGGLEIDSEDIKAVINNSTKFKVVQYNPPNNTSTIFEVLNAKNLTSNTIIINEYSPKRDTFKLTQTLVLPNTTPENTIASGLTFIIVLESAIPLTLIDENNVIIETLNPCDVSILKTALLDDGNIYWFSTTACIKRSIFTVNAYTTVSKVSHLLDIPKVQYISRDLVYIYAGVHEEVTIYLPKRAHSSLPIQQGFRITIVNASTKSNAVLSIISADKDDSVIGFLGHINAGSKTFMYIPWNPLSWLEV